MNFPEFNAGCDSPRGLTANAQWRSEAIARVRLKKRHFLKFIGRFCSARSRKPCYPDFVPFGKVELREMRASADHQPIGGMRVLSQMQKIEAITKANQCSIDAAKHLGSRNQEQ